MTSGQRQIGRGVIGLGIGFLIVIAVFAIVTIFSLRATQVERLPKAEQNDETLAIIKDCTSVGGSCYRRSQRQTAKAVGDIGATNILTVVCALDVPDGTPFDAAVKQVSRCVTDGLRERSDR